MRVVINKCFGGFGLSDAAYEWLIEHGIPARKYLPQERDEDGLWKSRPENAGRIIFDRELDERPERRRGILGSRYWDTWTRESRADPLLVQCVEALGEKARGACAKLEIVEIPDDVDYEIDEYDGMEHIAEKHRTWG